ncbi:MAG TPA: potassium transporter TrkG, partial [Pseudomonadales bacterium]|nr:potassium transporter TrkG [Pseudomonadales bacterium]
YSDNLMSFVLDPLINFPIIIAIICGGIGFPVYLEMRRGWGKRTHWSVHTKLTVLGTLILLPLGTAAILLYEWDNAKTLGQFDWAGKLLAAFFHSVSARTAGFNSLDVGQMHSETLAVQYFLMYVGGGSAGTAGGVKITTMFLLAYTVWAEIRGEPETTLFGRKVSLDVQRQALTVVFLSTTIIAFATLFILSVSDFPLDVVVFEVVSAFATVGLSTGITAALPASAQYALIALMFIGRVGTVTVATGLALRSKRAPYRYPEENPIVG